MSNTELEDQIKDWIVKYNVIIKESQSITDQMRILEQQRIEHLRNLNIMQQNMIDYVISESEIKLWIAKHNYLNAEINVLTEKLGSNEKEKIKFFRSLIELQQKYTVINSSSMAKRSLDEVEQKVTKKPRN